MKKLFVLILFLFFAATAARAIIVDPTIDGGDEPAVCDGTSSCVELGGVIFTNFNNTNNTDIATTGIPNFSGTNQSTTISSTDFTWGSTNKFELMYDETNDYLILTITNNSTLSSATTTYYDFTDNFSTFSKSSSMDEADLLKILVTDNDAGTISISDVIMYYEWNQYYENNYKYFKEITNVSADGTCTKWDVVGLPFYDDFTLVGTISVSGDFSTNTSSIKIIIGDDTGASGDDGDDSDNSNGDDQTAPNYAPVCDAASASIEYIWPPNHKLVDVTFAGFTDQDSDDNTLTIKVLEVMQDEPLNSTGDGNTEPDAYISDDLTYVSLRAERKGNGDSRFYHIKVQASDGVASCEKIFKVIVPHDQKKHTPVDQGALYQSTGTTQSRKAVHDPDVPGNIEFYALAPNPVTTTSQFSLVVDIDQHVVIDLYDFYGNKLNTIANNNFYGGSLYNFDIDATDLASGTYMIIMRGETFTHKEKVTVVK